MEIKDTVLKLQDGSKEFPIVAGETERDDVMCMLIKQVNYLTKMMTEVRTNE